MYLNPMYIFDVFYLHPYLHQLTLFRCLRMQGRSKLQQCGHVTLNGPGFQVSTKTFLKCCQIINYQFGKKIPVVLKTHLGVLGCSSTWVQLQGRPVLGHAGNFFDDELQQHKSLLEKWVIATSGCLRNKCSPKVHGHAGLNDSFSPHI